jgi:Capsule polysaccharide biosynthesis protein
MMTFQESVSVYTARIESWRRQISVSPPAATGEVLGVVVTPWQQTAVPWLSIEVALFWRSEGRPVVIFYDDANLGFNHYDERPGEGALIEQVLAACGDLIEVVRVKDLAPSDAVPLPSSDLDRLLFEVGVHRFYGEEPSETYLLQNAGIGEKYRAHLRQVAKAVSRVDRLFLPGGFFSVACLYTLAATSLGKVLTTYDCTLRGLWYCTDGVAAWSDTLPPALREMKQIVTETDWELMATYCTGFLEKRMTGNDYYQLQVKVAGDEDPDVDVLVCLNWRPDTAAILRQKLFPDVRAWLRKVGRWCVLNNKQLVIRRHPAERLEGYFVNDDIERQVRDLDRKGKFIRVVGPSDPVNTYDLLRNAKVVLPYTSQIGMEAIFLGKPTVLCTECFYGNSGIAWDADSQDAYFSLIDRACRGELTVDAGRRKLAALAYFIFQHGLEIVTEFRPLLECFEQWARLEPVELWNDELTACVRRILLDRENRLAVALSMEALSELRETAGSAQREAIV